MCEVRGPSVIRRVEVELPDGKREAIDVPDGQLPREGERITLHAADDYRVVQVHWITNHVTVRGVYNPLLRLGPL